MEIRKFLLFAGSFIFVATGCTSGNKNSVEGAEAAAADSIALPVVIEHLPDTVYPSASKVTFIVEVPDTTVSGFIEPLNDLYSSSSSIMTFRQGLKREADFNGRVDSIPTTLEVAWRFDTALDRSDTVYGPWGGGSGWTGQPLYVVWPDSLASKLKASGAVGDEFDGKEIMIGSLCGSVYFLNPATGKETRPSIPVGNPIKGTPSFDPTFNGFLYVGQGTPARRPFGALVVDLFKNNIIDFFPEDPKAQRRWGAYDSSPLRVGRFVFRPGENGSLYKYTVLPDGIRLHSVLRYKVNGAAPGMESSMAIFANYGYVTDNHGNVVCINLDNLRPVWRYTLGDDTDSSPVIVVEDGVPFIYVGCEIDRVARGYANFAKLNGLTGEEVWCLKAEGKRREQGTKHFDGGFYATALPGQGDCEHLIFTNLVKNTSGQNGSFLAINRSDGTIAYELPLKCYSWSSPAGILAPGDKFIVINCDGAGNMYLIDGKSGKVITSARIGKNFESSPLVVGNSVFIGSRGNGIYKVNLK